MGKSLGDLEQMILFSLISLGEDAYGASIRREIVRRTGREVSAGAVYTVLERLESTGLVVSRVGYSGQRISSSMQSKSVAVTCLGLLLTRSGRNPFATMADRSARCIPKSRRRTGKPSCF